MSLNYFSKINFAPSEKVLHAFLTRHGGLSEEPYDSLNLSPTGGDDEFTVDENYSIVRNVFSLQGKEFIRVNQIHSNVVYDYTGQSDFNTVEADAIVTALKGVPIGVLTADCLPIFLYDTVNEIVAVIHAGWRGTYDGIVGETINLMIKKYGSYAYDINAYTGPLIWTCCYEVGEDLKTKFEDKYGDSDKYFAVQDGKLRLNIRDANIEQMLDGGLSRDNIFSEYKCTSCEEKDFFSYRKSGGTTGRQLSFIMLRD